MEVGRKLPGLLQATIVVKPESRNKISTWYKKNPSGLTLALKKAQGGKHAIK